jgi:hypothetical protein
VVVEICTQYYGVEGRGEVVNGMVKWAAKMNSIEGRREVVNGVVESRVIYM